MLARLRPDGFTLALIAAVLLATALPARGSVADALAVATRIAIMLIFFLHGAKLSRAAVMQGAGAVKLHVGALGITYALFPAVALAAALLPSEIASAEIKAGFMFLAVLPSTVQSSIAFTAIAGGNVAAAVCSASLSNLLGVFLSPLLAGLLIHTQGAAGEIDTGAAIRTVVAMLLLPFIAGHLSRPLTAGFVTRHRFLLGLTDRGSILLVVYGAFSAAVVGGIWSRVSGADLALISVLSVVMLAVVLIASVAAARASGMTRADEIALLFCGSTKSLASGVPIAAALFAAPIVGVLMLPLMIYHQIQLIVCAVIARGYAERT